MGPGPGFLRKARRHDGPERQAAVVQLAEGEPKGSQLFRSDGLMPTARPRRSRMSPRRPAIHGGRPTASRIAFSMFVEDKTELKITMPKEPKGAEWTRPART